MKINYLSIITIILLLAGCKEDKLFNPDLEPEYQTAVFATGLMAPQGITVDAQGRLWVAEQGTGNNDGRISVVTSDGQVHPFIEALPSVIFDGSPASANHVLLGDINLWTTLSQGGSPVGNLLRFRIDGFSPVASPLNLNDAESDQDIGSFVLNQEFAETNIYDLAFGPNDDLFITDAAANAVIRQSANGELSVFATFEPIPNSTPVGPPVMDAVPTGLALSGNHFYVANFGGFPFTTGSARIYRVDLNGNVSLFKDGLTNAVDIDIAPDGDVVVVEFAKFGEMGFTPNTGNVIKLTEEGPDTLLTGLSFPAGISYAPNGDFYLAALADGQILKAVNINR